VLVSQFISQYAIMQKRDQADPIHNVQKWKSDTKSYSEKNTSYSELRLLCFQKFRDWNLNQDSPIVPVFYPVDADYCLPDYPHNILKLGFGEHTYLYGQGVYLYANVIDALSVCASMHLSKPCLILAFLNPGNPYPISSENLDKNNKLCTIDAALQSGYKSHIALSDLKGKMDPIPTSNLQFVIEQKNLAVPMYILHFDKNMVEKYYDPERTIPKMANVTTQGTTNSIATGLKAPLLDNEI